MVNFVRNRHPLLFITIFVQTFKLDTNFSIINKLIYPLSIECGEANEDLIVIQVLPWSCVLVHLSLTVPKNPPFTPS